MRYLLPFLLCSSYASARPSSLEAAIPQDVQLHMLASYAIDATTVQAVKGSRLRRLLLSNLVTMAVGTAKECLDTRFSREDLASDAVGAAVYTMVHLSFRF